MSFHSKRQVFRQLEEQLNWENHALKKTGDRVKYVKKFHMNIHKIFMDTTDGAISNLQTHQPLRKVRNEKSSTESELSSSKRHRISSPSSTVTRILLPADRCLFCKKKRKMKNKMRKHWQYVWQKLQSNPSKRQLLQEMRKRFFWKFKESIL